MNMFMLEKKQDLLRHWFLLKRQTCKQWCLKKIHRMSMENVFSVLPA
jgi:hypothetical protein